METKNCTEKKLNNIEDLSFDELFKLPSDLDFKDSDFELELDDEEMEHDLNEGQNLNHKKNHSPIKGTFYETFIKTLTPKNGGKPYTVEVRDKEKIVKVKNNYFEELSNGNLLKVKRALAVIYKEGGKPIFMEMASNQVPNMGLITIDQLREQRSALYETKER